VASVGWVLVGSGNTDVILWVLLGSGGFLWVLLSSGLFWCWVSQLYYQRAQNLQFGAVDTSHRTHN
jgi:hypothetical protein